MSQASRPRHPTPSAIGPSPPRIIGGGFGVGNDASQQAVRAGPELRLVVQSPRERGVGVAPRPLDLVHPEAVAADVVAQVHRVLDEEGVEPAPHAKKAKAKEEGKTAEMKEERARV